MLDWSEWIAYNEANVQEHSPEDKDGVYELNYLNAETDIFYIGSGNLKERLLAHLRSSEPNSCIRKYVKQHFCYFKYVEIDSKEERKRVEESEIKEHKPECNTVIEIAD